MKALCGTTQLRSRLSTASSLKGKLQFAPILDLGYKALASDLNAGAQTGGTQSLGAQTVDSEHSFANHLKEDKAVEETCKY